MSAVIADGSGKVTVSEVPLPEMNDYDALCKIYACAICTGTDLSIIDKRMNSSSIHYPAIIGHEAIGYVITTGSKVKFFKNGDLVTSPGATAVQVQSIQYHSHWGGFAEYGIIKDYRAMLSHGYAERDVMPYKCHQIIGHDIALQDGMMMVTWRETLSYLNRIGVHRGNTVLIIGSGSVALSFVKHCINRGLFCIIIGNERRKSVFINMGVIAFFDYKNKTAYLHEMENCSMVFNTIIDAAGDYETVNDCAAFLCTDGKIGLYGLTDSNDKGIISVKKTAHIYQGGYDQAEVHDEVLSDLRHGRLSSEDWFAEGSNYSMDNMNDGLEKLRAREIIKAYVTIG